MSKAPDKSKSIKAYHMMYVQQMEYLPAGNMENLIDLIENKVHPKEYAIIVHDKDPGEKPNLHCMLSFNNARSLHNIAKLLKEIDPATKKVKSQYVKKWDDRPNNGFAYLIHATEKARKEGKYQYDPSEVKANFNYPERIRQITDEIAEAKSEHGESVYELLNLLYIGAKTKAEIESTLSGAQYAKYHRQIEDVWAKRLQNMAENWRAVKRAGNGEITTIWIYGPAGTGKTSLAKKYAQKSGEAYYISGSSRDIFQQYAGEHKLILDELRPNVLPYADLLRITDPHGIDEQIMAPSRYFDKALACDLIIVTSPFDPWLFYCQIFKKNDSIDNFQQLHRRIALTVRMDEDNIVTMNFDDNSKTYKEEASTKRKNPYSSKNRQKATTAAGDIYNDLLDDTAADTTADKEDAEVTDKEPPIK